MKIHFGLQRNHVNSDRNSLRNDRCNTYSLRFRPKEDSWSRKWQVLNAAQARRDCNQSSIRAPILIINHFGCWHKNVNHIICYTSRRICYFATWVPAPRNNHNTFTKSKILKKVLRRDFWPSKLTNVSHLFSEMYCGDACFFFFVLRRCGRPCVGRLSPTFDNTRGYFDDRSSFRRYTRGYFNRRSNFCCYTRAHFDAYSIFASPPWHMNAPYMCHLFPNWIMPHRAKTFKRRWT